jgi:hypothetical protein
MRIVNNQIIIKNIDNFIISLNEITRNNQLEYKKLNSYFSYNN